MLKLSYRYAIAAIIMAGALFLLSPTLMPEDVNLPGASRISLGLDLKGGVQLTLGVDTEKAVQSALVNSGQVLRQKAREAGITVPIIPGIKPLSTVRHLTLLPQTFGCRIPWELEHEVLAHRDDAKAVRRIGTEWAIAQSRELKQAGVPVLHYYPMGKAENIIEIARTIF